MKFNFNLVIHLLLLFLFAYSIITSNDWPVRARTYTWIFAIPGFLMVLTSFLITTVFRKSGEKLPMQLDKKVFKFLGWLVGFVIFVWLFGFKITLILYSFLYLKVEGKRPLWEALLFTGIVYVLVFVLMEYLIGSRWPYGIIPGWFGIRI